MITYLVTLKIHSSTDGWLKKSVSVPKKLYENKEEFKYYVENNVATNALSWKVKSCVVEDINLDVLLTKIEDLDNRISILEGYSVDLVY